MSWLYFVTKKPTDLQPVIITPGKKAPKKGRIETFTFRSLLTLQIDLTHALMCYSDKETWMYKVNRLNYKHLK